MKFEQVSEDILQRVKEEFNFYADSFRKADDSEYNKHMELKQFHTSKVCEEIRLLCTDLKLNEAETAFAEIIAWLHDIGRFEQFDKYGTFSDAESENHSEIAIRVINERKLTDGLTSQQQEIVQSAILNHNKPRIPANEPEAIDFYSRMLRDADKLDIWRVAIEINIFHTIKSSPQPNHYEIPNHLFSYFPREKTIPLNEIDTFYDSILFRLSWIYDLNFPHTVRCFKERRLAEQFMAKLPPSRKLNELRELIDEYTLTSSPVRKEIV